MPKIRFFHAADIHIGATRKIPDYLKRQEQMLDCIFQNAEKYNCDFVLIAGDIYEDFKLTSLEKDLFLRKIAQYNNKPIVLINGQHDLVGPDYSLLSIVEDFSKLKYLTHVHIANMHPKVLNVLGWNIIAIPYNKKITTESMEQTVGDLLDTIEDKSKVLATFHGMVQGSYNDLGYTFSGGVILPLFDEISYWALGDIHKQHSVAKNAYYAGSPIQHRFDEVDENRGGLVVDLVSDGDYAVCVNVEPVYFDGIKKLKVLELSDTVTTANVDFEDDCYYSVSYENGDALRDLPSNVITTKKLVKPISYDYDKDLKHLDFKTILYNEMSNSYSKDVCDNAILLFDELYAEHVLG